MDRIDLSTATWIKSSYSGDNGGDCVEVATWIKSSYSDNDGGNCVEVATWTKSSYSDANGGNCIEIAPDFPAVVPVRDSKNPDGPVLVVTRAAWAAFTSGLC